MYADFTSKNRTTVRDYRDIPNVQVSNTSNSGTVKKQNKDRVNELLSMILKTNTTTVLNLLEEHRQKLNRTTFRSLILLLTTEFNSSTWTERLDQQNMTAMNEYSYRKRSQRQLPNQFHINRCLLIVLYYIVSVINKYKIAAADPIWTEILNNSETKTITFYRFLYKNKVVIPNTICTNFSETLRSFYSFRTVEDNIKLILLGFTIDMTIASYLRIKDYEKLFSELKQRQLFTTNFKPQHFLYPQMTSEELSLFLSYFSDYDLNTVDPKTNFNILDQIINMKPYFYIPREHPNHTGQIIHYFRQLSVIKPRDTDSSKLGSYPNEITKYRTARILNLFRSVILKGGQLSKPVFNDSTNVLIADNRFYITSIGVYALISLRMDDIYPNEYPYERDYKFVLNIIKLVKVFQPEFKEFLLHHLASSYSIIHKKQFIDQQRTNENLEIQKINDELFQKHLTLKEWCRLKIKDICPQKQINQLNLSKSLTDFCSFGLLNSNYALNSIKKVISYKGNLQPEYQNIFPVDDEQIIDDDVFSNHEDEYNSGVSVNSFNDSDI